MRKLKLLFAGFALLFGGISASAQMTDVTSTYITNPSFESDGNSAASNANLTITGWTETQSSAGSYNNTQTRDASTDNASAFGTKITPADGTYYLFYRHGWNGDAGTTASLKNTSMTELPAGIYRLEFKYQQSYNEDSSSKTKTRIKLAAKNGDTEVASVTTGDATKDATFGNDKWNTAYFIFKLDAAATIDFEFTLYSGGQKRSDFLLDGIRLLKADYHATPVADNTTDLYFYNEKTQQYLSAGQTWGTHAIVDNTGQPITAKLSDGTYTLATQEFGKYVGGLYMDAGSVNWLLLETAASSGKYYMTQDGVNYMTSNGAGAELINVTTPTDASVWTIVSKADRKTALASATIDTPIDATFLFADPNFGRNNTAYSNWTWTFPNGENKNNAGDVKNYVVECYHKQFTFKQTLAAGTAPAGVYALTAQGFYRQDGSDNDNLPKFFANGEEQTFPIRGAAAENSMNAASTSFMEGNYAIEPIYVRVEDSEAFEIGAKLATNESLWCIWDNFQLKYYGDVTVAAVKMKASVDAYNAAMTTAQAFTEASMFADAWTTLQNTITTNTVDLNDPALTESTLITATNNLVAANTAANAAVKARTVYDGAVALINGGTNVDLTSIVSNASFEEGNLNGWTSVNGGAPANNNNWSKDGTWYVERWTANGDNQNHLSNGTLIHDALVLPAGLYTITAKAQNQEQKNGVAGTGYFLYANDEKVEITGTNDYSTSVLLSTDKSELVIKFALENCTGNWISCDNIRLTYVGEDFPAYTLVTGKMNADVAAAQSAAEEAFLANKNITNYNALTTAIVAAQASKDAYAVAATAIANANALKEAHNLASTTAFNTFAEAIAAIETPYTNNTLSNNDANAAGTTLGTVVTGWHSGANGAAVKYMNDGFSLNDFDAALYINTWSNEGESDGSNFKVPFYEYFAGEGNALGENTWTGQVTDLDNGLYSVSAWVRVRSKNAETSAKDVYGISMDVNNGTAVDVTEGDTIAVNEGYGRFQHKVYTAEGLVKNGILKVNFNIAADNNIYWLSFKNIKYTKVRDLTPEEAAVLPTAIALKNGEDVVTEVELTAALNTITLTPSYTPANASEGYISWQSSNEAIATVAGGVVTGVAPGTTTITATSTLDTEISGSVTVTVTYPESEVPATYFVNDGATRTVYTLGENLFKNGSFEYPNAVYGWKTIDYTTDAVASNFTFNATGGVNDGVYITTAGGGVGSEKTLRKSIAIEKGKKYYFSVYTSGKAPSSDNFQYNALFKMSNATTESGTIKQFEWPQGAGNTTTEWSKTECIFTAETDYVGVRMGWNSSTSFDDFVLVEITDETVVGNVDYATAAIPTSNIGTAAFQYSQDAIDAANALVQGTATVEDVKNAYTAVTTLNAPEVGKLYNVVNITDGFAHKGKALTFKSASNADLSKNTTSMAWEAVPGSYLPQGVKFTAVDGTKNGYKLSYTRADGNEVYVSTGSLSGLGTNDDQIRPTTDASKALTFVVTSVGDNHWYLYNTAAGKNVGSNGDTGFYTAGGSNKDMKIQEAVENEVALNIDAANQYGTLILPFNADIPAGVTAYSVAETVGNKLTLDEEDAFVANTPYLVFAETGANETLSGLGSAYIDATYTEGLFTGVYAATAAPVGSYVLQKKNESLGFYKVAEGKQPTVGANRAYLTVPAAEARDAFFFGDGETTAIQALKALSEGNAEIYDVNGVRQNTLVKGMNILKMSDGSIRKVMVK